MPGAAPLAGAPGPTSDGRGTRHTLSSTNHERNPMRKLITRLLARWRAICDEGDAMIERDI